MLRVATTRPSYWKMRNLDDFDGAQLVETRASGSAAPTRSSTSRRVAGPAGWRETLRVTLRRMQTREVVGAGTTLGVEDTAADRRAGGRAGRLASRDRVPRRRLLHRPGLRAAPEPEQLAESGAGADPRRAADLT